MMNGNSGWAPWVVALLSVGVLVAMMTGCSQSQNAPDGDTKAAADPVFVEVPKLAMGETYALTSPVSFHPERNSDQPHVLFPPARITPIELVADGKQEWYRVELDSGPMWAAVSDLRTTSVEPYVEKLAREEQEQAAMDEQARAEHRARSAAREAAALESWNSQRVRDASIRAEYQAAKEKAAAEAAAAAAPKPKPKTTGVPLTIDQYESVTGQEVLSVPTNDSYYVNCNGKLHRAACRDLTGSAMTISKEKAKEEGLPSCTVCRP